MAFELPKGEEYKDMRRNLYEQLINHPTIVFDPNKHPRDAQLQEEFGPPEVFRETLTVEEEAAPVETETVETVEAQPMAEGNQYIDWAMDFGKILPLPPPTEEGYAKAERQLKGTERFLDRGFQRSDQYGQARMEKLLGDDIFLDEEKDVPEVDSKKSAVFQQSTLPGTAGSEEKRPGEPDLLEQEVFGSKTTEQKKEEELFKNPQPEIDLEEDVEITETEPETKPEATITDYKNTEGYQLGKSELLPDPYESRVKVYDEVLNKLYLTEEELADPVGDIEGSTSFFFGQEENYLALASDIKDEIDTYEDNINAIAEEKPGEAISGANKFWAVIAAALGAGAASITGTPNFAMQIINKTIDDHLEKFKADRDFRTKSAERQQVNLINERGRMLQMAQNAADSAAASLKDRRDVENKIATISSIKEQTLRALEKNDQDFYLAVQTLEFKKYESTQKARLEFGDKYVPGLGVTSIKDSDGIKEALKDGRKMMKAVRSIEELRRRALNLFNKVGTTKLLAQSAAGIKKAQGKDYIELRQLVGSLWGVYKNDIMKGGAALTPTEKVMINRVIPEEDIFTIGLGELKSALETLPNDYQSRLQGFQEAYQFMPATPVDYGFVQEGMPSKQIPNANKKSAKELGLKARYNNG